MVSGKIRIAIDTSAMDGRKAKGTAMVAHNIIFQLQRFKNDFEITLVHKHKEPDEVLYAQFHERVIPRVWTGIFGGVINEFLFFSMCWVNILLKRENISFKVVKP